LAAHGRHPSAQVVNIHEHHYLIDCGEGTQMQMTRYGIKRNKINQIFISHLHGDHVYGLVGLLTSYNLMGRKEKLEIFSPPGLETVMHATLEMSTTEINYPLVFHELDYKNQRKIFETDFLKVYSFPLIHRIPTCGFFFQEKPFPLNIRPEKIGAYQIPFSVIPDIKGGEDFLTKDGTIVPNKELTYPPTPPRSYAYCSDTIYTKSILPYIKGVDLLYHEATFLHDLVDHTDLTKHSTARQAAMIAQEANVDRLMLGHFSSRYPDLQPLLQEAKEVFPDSLLAIEGLKIDIPLKSTD
jgi:ribonuclease Z